MLKFQIQGSGKLPYTITAEGQGETFKMFCSCPAGRKGGVFCKHSQMLLLGDVSKLVGSSEGLADLAQMAKGSPLVGKAMTHKPKDDPGQWEHLETLEDVVEAFGAKLKALGFDCEITRDPGDVPDRLPRDELSLYAYFKNGKRRATPSHVLSFSPLGGDVDEDSDPDSPAYLNVRPRERPWGYKGKASVPGKAKSTLGRIVPDFLAGVGVK